MVGCPSCHQPSIRRKNWATCLPRKGGGVPLSALLKDQKANLLASSPQPPINAERQAGKLWIPFLKVFWYDSTWTSGLPTAKRTL